MRILILEDEVDIAKMVQVLLKKYFSNYISTINLAHNIEDALDLIHHNVYDLFLFDVNLGDDTSFEVLELTQNNPAKVIFITGHEQYAIQAIKNGALDYILKPIDISEFKLAIQKAITLINTKPVSTLDAETLHKKQLQSLQLSDNSNIHFVKLQDIVYLSSDGPYTTFYLENNSSLTSSKNLKQFEERLMDSGFYRVHNSYIINALKIKQINKIDGFTVLMTNDAIVDVSSRKKENFLIYLSQIIDI